MSLLSIYSSVCALTPCGRHWWWRLQQSWLALPLALTSLAATAQQLQPTQPVAEPKVVLISIDGLRWQEVFHGADPAILQQERFVRHADKKAQLPTQPQQLMPFFHRVIKTQGLLVGDRQQGSLMNVSNPWHFSYPGYNELLSGYADPAIRSNNKVNNPNVTVLEWLHQQTALNGKVAAVGSWDVLPYILNVERSGLPVNAGFARFQGPQGESDAEIDLLNQLQRQTPSPWSGVRLDIFTQRFALTHLKKHQPRLLYIAYGETDDFAHDGQYDQYLKAIARTDQFIAEIWQTLQADPFYRDQTTLIITTDHGRGEHAHSWQHHASGRAVAGYMKKLSAFSDGISGSDQIWLAALGPAIPARGIVTTQTPWQQSQVAATVAALFGYDWQAVQYKATAALPLLSDEQQLAMRATRESAQRHEPVGSTPVAAALPPI
jgi:hypothetical protein